MTLGELTHHQQVALAALVETVTMAGGRVTEGETRRIDGIVGELGEATYRSLLEEAETTFADEDELREFLAEIHDQNARELIYGTVLDEVLAEPTAQAVSSEWLDWLRGEWGIEVEIDEAAADDAAP
jgi:hypothetical protein